MNARIPARLAGAVAVVALLAACVDASPSISPSSGASPLSSSPSPSITASPTPALPATFPLAVVTGLTNPKATITVAELGELASATGLTVPCGVRVEQPALSTTASCVAADEIAAWIAAHQEGVALLPAGLVEPATKVLPIAGDGPFGLFGPDLFGDPEARALPYPVTGSPDANAALQLAWVSYDQSATWTMTSIGSLCSDRGAAYQAVTLGKGWDWVFGGGTATYAGPPYINPNPPPGIDALPVVDPVETGNDGLTASITRRADLALADHKCPILPTDQWAPNLNGPLAQAVGAVGEPARIGVHRARDFLDLGMGVRQEFVEGRIEQADRDRQARHDFEQLDEIGTLHRQQFSQCGARASSFILGRIISRTVRIRALFEEHVLGAAKADPSAPNFRG